jgi:hypothetical protein
VSEPWLISSEGRTRQRITLCVDDVDVHGRVADLIQSTPDDAVVRLQVTGRVPAMLNAAVHRRWTHRDVRDSRV